jgi:hypothetical protein
MKATLKLSIECGETTCASSPGVFCTYLETSRFGTSYHCHLFDTVMGKHSTQLGEKDGWIQRHPKCLELGKQHA